MQSPTSDIDLMVRSSGDVTNLAAAALNRIRELDRDLAVRSFITMNELVSKPFFLTGFSTFLLMMFAGFAIVLAMMGVYGVMSNVVQQRTHEIGIRIALGAESSDVLRMVLGQGMRLAVAGVALGTLSALAMAKLIASFSDLPFNITLIDLPIFILIALLLLAVALMPCLDHWRGARRRSIRWSHCGVNSRHPFFDKRSTPRGAWKWNCHTTIRIA